MEQKGVDKKPNGGGEDAYANLKSWLEGPDTIDRAFHQKDMISAVSMLVEPGEDVSRLTMRGEFPDSRFLKAAARVLAKCRKFHDKAGEEELLFVVSGQPGIKGHRANMLVEAIIGERKANIAGDGLAVKDTLKKVFHL